MARKRSERSAGRGGDVTQSADQKALNAYNDMLLDALSSSPPPGTVEDRPVKRRKVADTVAATSISEGAVGYSGSISDHDAKRDVEGSTSAPTPRNQQTAYHDSDDSAESDFDWEAVEIDANVNRELSPSTPNEGSLDLVLGGDAISKVGKIAKRRKPISLTEKNVRLEIHKVHVLCLIAHVHLRNHWCNDEIVHSTLRSLLSKKTVSYLNPNESHSQFQRTRSFLDGLTQAAEIFRLHFKITTRGMARSYWAENADDISAATLPKDIELPIEKTDFRDLAQQREASRDTGVQLFCALLRSVGVDARLVCSLQPLPFSGAAKGKPATPVKPPMYMALAKNAIGGKAHGSNEGNSADPRSVEDAIGTRGGRNRFGSGTSPAQGSHSGNGNSSIGSAEYIPMRSKRIVESSYPVYWVEAFDEAAQKWVPIDPLSTKTIGKPAKLEPPSSDPENNMSYVFAFEDDGSARDVTRRYVKAFNAKTRKARVESTPEGVRWLKRALRMFRRPHILDRDQLEDTEFARKEAQEPLPDNVQDFKDHPYYVLERHLKRSEVIYPKRESGKVISGRAGHAKASEPIYRRSDVHVVRSADSWYRSGRAIKPGEQALKRVAAGRKQRKNDESDQTDSNDEGMGTALYAIHQTIVYEPPPVVNERVPKNVYGNLDIYTPSMVPPGGAHVVHPECARAARLLGVDYADAVTGFAFKGRHGTAIINGGVIAKEHVNAVLEIISGFAHDRDQEEKALRSHQVLSTWRRFLSALKIKERIEGYSIDGEATAPQEAQPGLEEYSMDYEAGGFFPEGGASAMAEPTAGKAESRLFDNVTGGDSTTDGTATEYREKLFDIEAKAPKYDTDDFDLGARDAVHEVEHLKTSIEVVYGKDHTPSTSEPAHLDPGGFVLEDQPEALEASPPAAVDRRRQLYTQGDADLAQATMLHNESETQSSFSEPTDYNISRDDLGSPEQPKAESDHSREPAIPTTDQCQIPIQQTTSQNQGATTMDNKGSEVDEEDSLLSEDPEDEDADPEWLV